MSRLRIKLIYYGNGEKLFLRYDSFVIQFLQYFMICIMVVLVKLTNEYCIIIS